MIRRKLLGVIYVLFLFGTACGGCDDPDPNACDGVVCDRGICDLSTGECANAGDCGGDDDSCLAGFACNGTTCEAQFPCDGSGNCERGVCLDGACVNPDSCNTNASCLPGSFCDGSTCEEDPCVDVTCDRGICEVGIGECVNADTCTRATQEEDCLGGFQCVEGACVNEEEFCNQLNCTRGVCSVEDGECIDAEDCGGSDMNCLAGNYCAADNTCQQNLCDALMTNCPRGVCDAGAGQCVDADPCAAETECIDGNVCVGGTCVLFDDACGVGGCPGNQTCVYDSGGLAAACEESIDGCTTSLDCLTDRACVNGACEAPGVCSDDALEPNDDAANVTDYFAVVNNGAVTDLTICGADTDLFEFRTDQDPDLFGTLFVTINVLGEDVGLGVLTLELLNSQDQVVGTATTEANGVPVASAELTRDIDVITQGVYRIRVTGENVNAAGVRYELRADVLDATVLAACQNVTVLDTTAPQTGDTTLAVSSAAESCSDASGVLEENIWQLDVPVDSFATIRVTPQVNVDLALTLRTVCAQDESALQCENFGGVNDSEQIEISLTAGTYFVMVEGEQNAGGAYLISASLEPVICTPADNTCLDVDNANVCNARGTAFDVEACMNGCDQAAGRCSRDPGDVCATAIPVDNQTGYTGTVVWDNFVADYDPGTGACIPGNTQSDGADAVFAVTIPDGSAVDAFLDRDIGVYISLYLVTDCNDVIASCLAGVNDGDFTDERLVYVNNTGADINAFLIADLEAASPSTTPSPITIDVNPVVCTPGSRQCVLNRESQLCNDSGTGFDSTTVCDNGCDMVTGECIVPLNDLCDGAIVLTPGVGSSGDLSILNADYSSSAAGCSGSSNGRDSVFLLQNLQAGDSVQIDMDSDFDSVLWVATECTMNAIDSCIERADSAFGGINTETVNFVVSTPGDYYVIADAWSSGTTSGTFTVTATVSPGVCTPGENLGCADATTLNYCDAFAQIASFTCGGGSCAGSQCAAPGGDFCADAIPLAANPVLTTVNGSLGGFTNSIELSGNSGNCSFSSATDEGDVVYRIDLPADSTLEAAFDGNSSSTRFYMIDGDCSELATGCFGNQNVSGDHTIEYFTPVAKTVHLVVDTTFSTSTSFTIDYQVLNTPGRQCSPNNNTCITATDLEVCDSNGMIQGTYTCPGGCANGACDDDPATMETCLTAPNVGTGIVMEIDYADYLDDIDVNGSASCNKDTNGRDAHLAFTMQADDILVVTATGIGTSSHVIYAYTDCNDIAATCETFDDASPAELIYQSPIAQTVYLGIDHEFDSSSNVLIDAQVKPPECINGQPAICNATGDALEYCDRGVIKEYPCGGNGLCIGSTCDQPQGNQCFDTIPLARTVGQLVTVNDQYQTSSGTPPAFAFPRNQESGQCRLTGSTFSDGSDVVFTLPLLTGDRVDFTFDGSTDSFIIISDSCLDPTQCLSNNIAAQDFTHTYVSDADKTVYVVARSEFSSSSSFTFDYLITPGFAGACTPDQFYCMDASTVAGCDADGNVTAMATCANGCFAGACDTSLPGSDTCIGAPVIGNGTYLIEYFGDGNDDSNLTAASCLGEDSPGSEFFYAVDLLQNDILTVTQTAFDNSDNPAIYFFRDCADIEGSCIGGTANGDPQQTLTYQAQVDERIYIAMDTEFSSDFVWQSLFVEIAAPNCVPGVFPQACNVDNSGFEYCDATGFIQTYDCGGPATCDAASGRCLNPVGETCFDPFDANPAVLGTPEVFGGSFSGRIDDYSLETGNVCTGSITPAGDDAYVVDLLAGQVLTASVVSTEATPEDIAIYINTDCDGLPASCVDGSDVQGAVATPESATYTAVVDETVFVIVDSFFGATSGTYDLTIDVQ